LLKHNEVNSEPEAMLSYNLDISSFKTSKRKILKDFLEDCFAKYPHPHVHNISKDLEGAILSVEPSLNISSKVVFMPLVYRRNRYSVLSFVKDNRIKKIPDDFMEEICDIIPFVYMVTEYQINEKNLKTLENFVKEVGHDIASSVQATVSKLRNISKGLYDSHQVIQKALEAKEEILNAYRVAENLGFAVDPDYNIKEGGIFDIVKSAEKVIQQYKSEANERNITIDLSADNKCIEVWGDASGIESCISQFLINAIKYAYGSSEIYITISDFKASIKLEVSNKGIPLKPQEIPYLWDFGFRGEEAYDRHVNGSGIGLSSVKKIITAHNGNVAAHPRSESLLNVSVFSFTIPKRQIAQKSKLI
jgi:two-component system heavy metal sensor histidine kinase CusS